MRALWGRSADEASLAFLPPRPAEQPDEMLMQAYSAWKPPARNIWPSRTWKDFLKAITSLSQLMVNDTCLDTTEQYKRTRQQTELQAKWNARSAPLLGLRAEPKPRPADPFQAPAAAAAGLCATQLSDHPTHLHRGGILKFINEVMNPPYPIGGKCGAGCALQGPGRTRPQCLRPGWKACPGKSPGPQAPGDQGDGGARQDFRSFLWARRRGSGVDHRLFEKRRLTQTGWRWPADAVRTIERENLDRVPF
jgi:hypothetical protein